MSPTVPPPHSDGPTSFRVDIGHIRALIAAIRKSWPVGVSLHDLLTRPDIVLPAHPTPTAELPEYPAGVQAFYAVNKFMLSGRSEDPATAEIREAAATVHKVLFVLPTADAAKSSRLRGHSAGGESRLPPTAVGHVCMGGGVAIELADTLNWFADAAVKLLDPTDRPPTQEAATASSASAAESSGHQPAAKRKAGGRRGGKEKLVAALSKHHRYSTDGPLNLDPIGCNDLARKAGVVDSSASAFFKKKFGGYKQYADRCRDARLLAAALRLLNGEFAPKHLYGRLPPGEHEQTE